MLNISHQIWPSGLHADDCTGCAAERKVKQIQLDAYKAGMTRAAEIAEQMRISTTQHYGVAESVGADRSKQAILTERDNLKEISLQ